MRVAAQVVLTEEQRSELSAYARRRSVALRLVERANIILQAAEGKQDQEIAAALELGRHTVARWRARFLQHGIAGIEKDAPRPGRTRTIDPEEIIRKTTQEKPAQATHWTTRTLARTLGISEATVRRAWHAHGLKPHLVDTFKVSRDPQFVEKLEDIVGLYLNPPQQAIVFSVDEKSQIQALDRTQPSLPMKKGRKGTMTHDYKRHGTTTLFAALNTLTAVGGTEFNEPDSSWSYGNSLNGTSAPYYFPEIGWNDTSKAAGLRASGGGASALYPKPSWQVGLGVPDDHARDIPDLAFTASPAHDPYFVITGGKAYAAGGTSLSAPVFAGILAIAEQPQRPGDTPGFGNINPSLYALRGQFAGDVFFHDVITGNNLVPCAAGTQDCLNGSLGYTAGPGYDLVTGLGSLNVAFFVNVVQLATTTALSVSQTEVPEGIPITATATVRSYNGAVPTGTVGFGDQSGGASADVDATGSARSTFLLPHGTHSITATFLPGCCSRFVRSTSAPVTVVVDATPPPAPALTTPADNATDVSVSVRLLWGKSPFATSYDVYFGTSPSPPFWGNTTDMLCTPGALAPNTRYYWKVAAKDEFGAAASPVRSFTTTGSNLYTISTVIGSTTAGFSPDGVSAANALLSSPIDVALDRGGNLYVVEAANNRIRKLSTNGILSTVAGGGTGGDGGPAASARIDNPGGIVLDPQGNLYFSESFTSDGRTSIRKVSPAGIITTVAGGGAAGYSGDGDLAANAKLSGPTALALDSLGNLYFADGNSCVRKIAAGVISTVAGQCANGGYPFGSDIGDGGPATSAALYYAGGVAVDSFGNLYIADSGNCRLRKVTGGIITTVAGLSEGGLGCGGGAIPFATIQPLRVTIDPADNLYFTSFGATVVKLANGVLTTIAGGGSIRPGDGGPATSVNLGGLMGLTLDPSGRIYLAEGFSAYPGGPSLSHSIRLLAPSSSYVPPAPSIAVGGMQNGASFALAPVAPGSIANIFGNFGFGSPAQPGATPLPTELSGLSIQFPSAPGLKAPLFYASAGQINIQVPWELAGQTSVPIRAVLNGANGPSQNLKLAAFAPGIFTVGMPYPIGAIVDSSYRLLDFTNPASAGSLIQIYCTGLGPVTNPPSSGSPASSATLSATITKPTVTVGGVLAELVFSGLAPGTVGEYQVNVKIPSGVAPGLLTPVVLSIGGVSSNTVTIAVK